MSSNSQSKRMLFANRMRNARTIRRITKDNKEKPGFSGVALRMQIGGKWFGAGALFITEKGEK